MALDQHSHRISHAYTDAPNRIFKTTLMEKRNQVNFKVIKHDEEKDCIEGSVGRNTNSDIESEDIEKKKELEKLLDNFMTKRKNFQKNYLDILICK